MKEYQDAFLFNELSECACPSSSAVATLWAALTKLSLLPTEGETMDTS